MWSNLSGKVLFFSTLFIVALLPIFFIPFTTIAVSDSKSLLVVLGLALAVIAWAVSSFSRGQVSFPRSHILLAGLAVVASFLISALVSASFDMGMFGTFFDIGSFYFILAAFLLMFFGAISFRDHKSSQVFLFSLLLSSVLLLLFQLGRVFFPEILSFGVLSGKIGNLFGSWHSLGLWAGFSCLLALIFIEFFSVNRIANLIFTLIIILSLFMMATTNFMLAWQLVGFFALIVFVCKIFFSSQLKTDTQNISFPISSFSIVIISLLFFMSSNFVGSFLPNKLGVFSIEPTPYLSETLNVTKQVLKNDPLFGVGPAQFGQAWSMYKNVEVNNSMFWDSYFSFGSGLIPSLVSMTGLVGLAALLVFFITFIFSGIKFILLGTKNAMYREITTFFLLSLYLFVASFLYNTGFVIFLTAFAMTGVFIGLTTLHHKKDIVISFLDDGRKSFVSILVIVSLMVVAAGLTFKFIERFASVSYFGQASQAKSVEEGERLLSKAVSLYQNDLYLRNYAEFYLLRNVSLVNKEGAPSEEDKLNIKSFLDKASLGALSAVDYNPKNYLNYKTLGNVYTTMGTLGVKDGYAEATKAYIKAIELNPANPGLKLSLAKVYFAEGKTKEAKDFATQASNITPAYFVNGANLEVNSFAIDVLITLSQISKKAGSTSEALSYAKKAQELSPKDKSITDYINSLQNGN
mgnify:CR=1 FL=1